MIAKCLLWCLVLSSASFLVVYAHMLIEEKSATNESSSGVQVKPHSDPPPVLVVELPKVRKNKNDGKKQRKNKFGGRSKRPPPPANCVPLWGSCKPPNGACCEYCAFCQCRLFKTHEAALQPNLVAQVVQLLQDGTSIRAVARFAVSPSSLKSMEEIPGDGPLHKESWTGPKKGINPAAGPVSAPLCEEEQEEHCQSPTKLPPVGYWCACF
ncbi:hypothetical protein SKAU_G00153990 [Synaphobranchus kaupii]|uniref:Agouti-signaling protein n=1 Tax=Synaphobranchus kaupii TaxID=118154 RepID=A0A9Q1IWZ1_SYNKA|nr:hypothetical protein SKAU_G00153990 [Synaphobranchus kaupii]